eukprot:TRINITY_DN6901_c0_g1_i2.p1 TRINITY_DN6901_c0_g1~~TRINITY_DN6901_c0_g1_i2.p1  ORF type:complete len:181 (+),score=56.39 TRINITY_DN6901_c0_g1_i2:113-655(+)
MEMDWVSSLGSVATANVLSFVRESVMRKANKKKTIGTLSSRKELLKEISVLKLQVKTLKQRLSKYEEISSEEESSQEETDHQEIPPSVPTQPTSAPPVPPALPKLELNDNTKTNANKPNQEDNLLGSIENVQLKAAPVTRTPGGTIVRKKKNYLKESLLHKFKNVGSISEDEESWDSDWE